MSECSDCANLCLDVYFAQEPDEAVMLLRPMVLAAVRSAGCDPELSEAILDSFLANPSV